MSISKILKIGLLTVYLIITGPLPSFIVEMNEDIMLNPGILPKSSKLKESLKELVILGSVF